MSIRLRRLHCTRDQRRVVRSECRDRQRGRHRCHNRVDFTKLRRPPFILQFPAIDGRTWSSRRGRAMGIVRCHDNNKATAKTTDLAFDFLIYDFDLMLSVRQRTECSPGERMLQH